jgi:hypothetical protein
MVYSVLPAPQGHGIRTMAKLPLVPPPTLNTSVSELTAKETIVNILDLQNLPAAGATPAGRLSTWSSGCNVSWSTWSAGCRE